MKSNAAAFEAKQLGVISTDKSIFLFFCRPSLFNSSAAKFCMKGGA
jgi:hypothetical protein